MEVDVFSTRRAFWSTNWRRGPISALGRVTYGSRCFLAPGEPCEITYVRLWWNSTKGAFSLRAYGDSAAKFTQRNTGLRGEKWIRGVPVKSLPLGCDGAQERVRFLSVPMGTLELSLHNGIQASRCPAPDFPGDPRLLPLLHGKKHSPHPSPGWLVGW